jgi:hypothetical protein
MNSIPETVEPVDELLALDGYEENPFFVERPDVHEQFAKFYAQPALTQKLLPAPAKPVKHPYADYANMSRTKLPKAEAFK